MKKSVFASFTGMLLFVLLFSSMDVNAQGWKKHVDKFGFDVLFPNTPARVELIPGTKAELTQQAPGFAKFILLYETRVAPWVLPADIDFLINAHATSRGGFVVAGSLSPLSAVWKGGNYKTAQIESAAGLRCNIFVFVIGNERFLLAVENNGVYAPAADWAKFWNSLNP